MVQIWRWVSWMMTIFKKIFRRVFILRKFLANNSTIIASITYIFAMCLALCFTNILFKFLDHPMGSESLSPLYKYRTESQRGKWLALCHTSCQMEEPGFKLMCIWHQALFGISHCLRGLPQRLFPRGKETVCQMQEMWVWSLGWDDPLEKEMATHSLGCILDGKSQGQRSLVGSSSWGRKTIGQSNNNIASLLKIYNFPRFFQQGGNYFFWA